jgi:HD-like signal output (HDOD) protein
MSQTAPVAPDFAAQLRADIAANRIQLPTLPEVALRVREAVESENTNAAAVAGIVTQDPALTARLLQVANSPLYRAQKPIDNVQMAITRMGVKLVKNLVVSLAMKQIFQATSDALDKAFRELWNDSLEIAAIARVLSYNVDGLEPEQAMLAGLIHNIGALPILTKLEHDMGFDTDRKMMNRLLHELAPELGCEILHAWQFAEELQDVPRDCLDLERSPAKPDYADLVLVARLQHLVTVGKADERTDMPQWENYSAFDRIGLQTEITVMEMEGSNDQIAAVRDMLAV